MIPVTTRLAIAVAVFPLVLAAQEGRRIYTTGESSSGHRIVASVAGEELPGSLLACLNCHGADGRGLAEGGVVPSDITWLELTKPYATTAVNGRRRPPYDEARLRRAITSGVDAAGNTLNSAMPRYAMPDAALSELIGYLKAIGDATTPGVSAEAIQLSTIVPQSGAGRDVAAVLRAYFAEAGAIHGRRITLDVIEIAANEDHVADAVERRLSEVPPLAIAGGLISGFDGDVARAVERAQIPMILPTSRESDDSSANSYRYYLHPGIEQQLRGLVAHVKPSKMIISAEDAGLPLAQALSREFGAQVQGAGVTPGDGETAVLYVDPPRLRLGNTVYQPLPALPADLTPAGVEAFQAFRRRHALGQHNTTAQLNAYTAAAFIVDALRAAGRAITPGAFRSSIESVYGYTNGLTPPLTFSRQRKTGSITTHIAAADLTTGEVVIAGSHAFH